MYFSYKPARSIESTGLAFLFIFVCKKMYFFYFKRVGYSIPVKPPDRAAGGMFFVVEGARSHLYLH